jgi:hypothetical protein
MSYDLMPYAVDFGRLRAAVGSGDERLLAELASAHADEMTRLDRHDEDHDPPIPPAADVLRHLILGEAGDPAAGFKYGYALEWLCEHFGEPLNNSEWSAMRGQWFDTVGEALVAAGVPATFSVLNLAFRGSPVPIPEPDDFPGIGYFTPEEVPAAAAALDAADLGTMPEDVRKSVGQVRDWLGVCEETGRGLVCFYA